MRKVDRCPVCNSNAIVEVAALNNSSRERYLSYSDIKYAGLLDEWLNVLHPVIDQCKACGHHWYREQPSDDMLSTMYSQGRPLKAKTVKIDRSVRPEMVTEMRRLRRLICNDKVTLLDYGSGFGRWARAAVEAGFEVTAFEPSKTRGTESSEVPFRYVCSLDEIAGQKFDAINLEQVLEHTPDPLGVLKMVASFCDHNSVVRTTVPNILRCPEGKKIWDEWPFDGTRAHTMAPFEHLHGFTPKSLETAFNNANFVPVSGVKIWSLYPMQMSRKLIGKFIPKLGITWGMTRLSNKSSQQLSSLNRKNNSMGYLFH